MFRHGKNTVGIYYFIKNGEKKSKLTLAPIVNFRGFHTTNNKEYFDVRQDIEDRKVRLVIDNNSQNPIYTYLSDGKYIKHDNDVFRNMYYLEEEKRGQVALENHVVPGVYEVEIEPNENKYLTFVCSLEQNIEENKCKDLINKEIMRLSTIIYDTDLLDERKKESKDPEYINLVKNFVIAADSFVVYRPSFAL